MWRGSDSNLCFAGPVMAVFTCPLLVTHLILRGSENKTDVLVPDILLKGSPFPSPLLLTID